MSYAIVLSDEALQTLFEDADAGVIDRVIQDCIVTRLKEFGSSPFAFLNKPGVELPHHPGSAQVAFWCQNDQSAFKIYAFFQYHQDEATITVFGFVIDRYPRGSGTI